MSLEKCTFGINMRFGFKIKKLKDEKSIMHRSFSILQKKENIM